VLEYVLVCGVRGMTCWTRGGWSGVRRGGLDSELGCTRWVWWLNRLGKFRWASPRIGCGSNPCVQWIWMRFSWGGIPGPKIRTWGTRQRLGQVCPSLVVGYLVTSKAEAWCCVAPEVAVTEIG